MAPEKQQGHSYTFINIVHETFPIKISDVFSPTLTSLWTTDIGNKEIGHEEYWNQSM